MPRTTPLDRGLVLLAVLLASYQVVEGIDGHGSLAVACYTVGFGALLVAGLLVIILGLDILDSPHVAVVASIIPLSLSTGLAAEFFPAFQAVFLSFALAAFLAVVLTRYRFPAAIALIVLAGTHAAAGLIIFILPLLVSLSGKAPLQFGLVGVGGALIGLFGLMLSFLKADRFFLTQGALWRWFPLILLIATAAFVLGFAVL